MNGELILDVPLLTRTTEDSGCDSSSPQSSKHSGSGGPTEELNFLLVPKRNRCERRGSFIADVYDKAASVTKVIPALNNL